MNDRVWAVTFRGTEWVERARSGCVVSNTDPRRAAEFTREEAEEAEAVVALAEANGLPGRTIVKHPMSHAGVDTEAAVTPPLQVGERVHVARWGEGIVESVGSGTVNVRFRDGRVGRFAAFAEHVKRVEPKRQSTTVWRP